MGNTLVRYRCFEILASNSFAAARELGMSKQAFWKQLKRGLRIRLILAGYQRIATQLWSRWPISSLTVIDSGRKPAILPPRTVTSSMPSPSYEGVAQGTVLNGFINEIFEEIVCNKGDFMRRSRRRVNGERSWDKRVNDCQLFVSQFYSLCYRFSLARPFMIWLLDGAFDARSRRRLLCLIINAVW